MLEFLRRLEERRPEARMSLGLERVDAVLDALGRPERGYEVVLVAGTNGKGTTTRFLERIAMINGRRVGSYSSPHVFSPTERIRLAGVDIEPASLAQVLEPLVGRYPDLTYFELMTVAAAKVFADSGMDLAIFEIGLGGRLDACNALDSVVATAITGVDYDHMQVLGATLTEIAGEKAAIVREGRPAVIGDLRDEAAAVVGRVAAARGALLRQRRRVVLPNWPGPSYLLHNLGVAMEVGAALGFEVPAGEVEAILAARPFGRWTLHARMPLKVIDGAHNAQGLATVGREFVQRLADARSGARIWFAAGQAKDLDGLTAELAGLCVPVTAVELPGDGWHSPDDVLRRLPESLRAGRASATVAREEFDSHSGPALWAGSLRGLDVWRGMYGLGASDGALT